MITGALIGGLISGIASSRSGKSFWEGAEDGAFSGALIGAAFGAIGGAGQLAGSILGKSCAFIETYGNVIRNSTIAANILNLGMAGFDIASLFISIDNPNSKIVLLNRKLHSSILYNGFQLTVGIAGAFGSGMVKGIKYDIKNNISKCFIAGTMIYTVAGLTAIEKIKPGDKVLSTDPDTFITSLKTVLETYIRKTTELIHLFISGEEIVTTEGHPFYVKDIKFVKASELKVGDELFDADGKTLIVEEVSIENTKEPVKVYNFQVEDFINEKRRCNKYYF